MNTAQQVANTLLQIKAIKLSPQKPFTWASGLKSPIYCDNRILLSHPAERNFIKQCFIEAAHKVMPFDLVAGVATAGIPHGALLADALQLPFVYVRSEAKKHGRQNLIEGEVQAGSQAVLIEDLISTGGSSLAALGALRQAGVDVKCVLAIFTYNFEIAKDAFKRANCPLVTLTDYDTLIREALTHKYITLHDLDMLTTWRTKMGSLSKR